MKRIYSKAEAKQLKKKGYKIKRTKHAYYLVWEMKEFIKHYIKFLTISKGYLGKGYSYIVLHGGLKKAYISAKEMCKYNKMTEQEKLLWYVNENRVIEL